MADIKNKIQGIDPNLEARNVKAIADVTGNIYTSLVIIGKRAKQLNADLKVELHQKLEEFAVTSDTIEEMHENKEQIEISKFYERLPNPTIVAMTEFLDGGLTYTLDPQAVVADEDDEDNA